MATIYRKLRKVNNTSKLHILLFAGTHLLETLRRYTKFQTNLATGIRLYQLHGVSTYRSAMYIVKFRQRIQFSITHLTETLQCDNMNNILYEDNAWEYLN